jgi:hypothetical protein
VYAVTDACDALLRELRAARVCFVSAVDPDGALAEQVAALALPAQHAERLLAEWPYAAPLSAWFRRFGSSLAAPTTRRASSTDLVVEAPALLRTMLGDAAPAAPG